jgi:hypothetical protein
MKTAVFARTLLLLSLASAAGALLESPPALAANEAQTLRRMVDLNKRALAAHAAGRHQTARKVLLDALAAGQTAGLENHDMTARTHIHLGVVTIVGLKEREDGLAHFNQALRIRPAIRLTPKLSTPALEADLELMRRALPPAPAPGQAPLASNLDPAQPASAAKPKETSSASAQKLARWQAAVEQEPDVPVSIPQPLYCPVPVEGPPSQEVNLRCLTQPEIRVNKVVAYFRPAGGETYTPLLMTRTRKGWYSAVVPANQVTGRSLQFYFEAHGAANNVAVRNGKGDSPNVIVLKEGAPPVGVGALAALQTLADSSGASAEQSPLELREGEIARSEQRALLGRRAPGSFWIGLGLGNGLGWHGRRPLERHPRRSVTRGVSPVGMGQIIPELGWQLGEHTSLSLQSRHQYLPASGSGDAEATGAPPTTAHAVMARLQYSLVDLGDFEVLGSAALGGGSALRMMVEPARELGLVTSDTVVVGPIVGGLGVGLAYNFNDRFMALAEGRSLAAGWNFGVLLEVNAGVQLAF